ncbi:MAG: helix-turn-helix transcriptional regulator [Solirubrobacteraceae bacterium]
MTGVDAMAGWRTNGDLISEQLRVDQDFRAEWERTSVGRAVATALVRYRADHGFWQGDLAERLGVGRGKVARLEIGEAKPSADEVRWLSAQLGT